jgi:hypothetical protein
VFGNNKAALAGAAFVRPRNFFSSIAFAVSILRLQDASLDKLSQKDTLEQP